MQVVSAQGPLAETSFTLQSLYLDNMRLIVLHESKWTGIELMFVLIAHNTQQPLAKVLF